jgi:hypothetical protein
MVGTGALVCRHGAQLTPELRVLHLGCGKLAPHHVHIIHDRMVLLLQVLDGVRLSLVLGDSCGVSVTVRFQASVLGSSTDLWTRFPTWTPWSPAPAA